MYKYRSVILSLISALTFACSYGQKSNSEKSGPAATSNSDSTEAQIALIRKEYYRIIAEQPNFKVVTEDMDDQSAAPPKVMIYICNVHFKNAHAPVRVKSMTA